MKTKDITLMALLLAVLIVCSQLSIPLQPVPITLQTFAVLLIGMVLPPKAALMVTGAYAVIGVLGLPVFAGYSGGFASVVKPPFGFVLGFILAAWAIATYLQKTHPNFTNYLIAGLIGSVIIYAIGVPYMGVILNQVMGLGKSVTEILQMGMIPFLLGDAIKVVLAASIALALQKPLRRFRSA